LRIQAHLLEQCDPELAEFFGWPAPGVRILRDRALFQYFLATGGRVSEVLQVHRSTFERETVRQKGGSEKEFTCPPGVSGLIHTYLSQRTDRLDMLWVAFAKGGPVRPLQDSGVLKIWERLAARYSVPRFTTHQLRHTSATLLSKLGHDPLVIANHLGHADLRSVQVYTKVASNKLQAARADLDVA
jgi:integrase